MKPSFIVLIITILTSLIAPRFIELAFADPQFDAVRAKTEQGDADAQNTLCRM